jgi:hypothetical protein
MLFYVTVLKSNYESGNNRHKNFLTTYFLTTSYQLPTDFPDFYIGTVDFRHLGMQVSRFCT